MQKKVAQCAHVAVEPPGLSVVRTLLELRLNGKALSAGSKRNVHLLCWRQGTLTQLTLGCTTPSEQLPSMQPARPVGVSAAPPRLKESPCPCGVVQQNHNNPFAPKTSDVVICQSIWPSDGSGMSLSGIVLSPQQSSGRLPGCESPR